VFDHLRRLTDDDGLWEHARYSTPRLEHGYCTDDNARALVVVAREGDASAGLADLAATYLRFVLDARTADGGFHNRRGRSGSWLDDVGSDDSQGRAWWALGSAARYGPEPWMRRAGADAFTTAGSFGSPHLRSNAYAALGAAEMLAAEPGHPGATTLLRRTTDVIAAAARERIVWPEPRLTYDNARLPEALLAAGIALGDRHKTAAGLRLLEWLVRADTSDGHFSFTPAGGWAPGEPRPGFDQQPIEAWAMAEACHRAWISTGDDIWRLRAIGAARWLMGRNDTAMALYESATGATGDGLMEDSVNQNQGAESTLAGLAALQIAAACTAAGRGAAIV
jgi:hypothetical protein